MTSSTVKTRPGGRTAKVRTAVLNAVVEILAIEGWEALTIEAVAQRSEVHKTTIYRRWGDRVSLAAEAVTAFADVAVHYPDTGTLLGDLTELADGIVRELRSPAGRALLRLSVVDNVGNPELDHLRQRFFADRYRRVGPTIERAIARGEAPTGTDPIAVAQTLSAPLLLRVLITGDSLDDNAASRSARVTATAVSQGALVP